MAISDLRGKTPDELKDQLLGLKKEQFNLRFPARDAAARKARPRLREVRREIARIKTVLNAKSPAAK